MIRPRARPDGLPPRVYERFGTRTYSIGYKGADGAWAFRLKCPTTQPAKVAELRLEAIRRAADVAKGVPANGSFEALTAAWMLWQRTLPDRSTAKRAETTLAENAREIAALNRSFGTMQVTEMEKADAYDHLDACLVAKDRDGNLRPRPEKGNKEIALARTMLEWGVRRRWLSDNPFAGVEKLITEKQKHLVAAQEIALAVEVGRRMGGPQHIAALACQTARLCVRRSVEVRAMTRDQIDDERGIFWRAAKRQKGQAELVGLIEWSPALRATIDEALAIKRHEIAGSWYVFGNLSGQRYTKGGWKATMSRLMAACVEEAARRKLAFTPFSLQDCRPSGVTAKLERGDRDTQDATMHTSERMMRATYDRRKLRVAKPAG